MGTGYRPPLIVGLDPSPLRLGWGVLNDETELPVVCGCHWLPDKQAAVYRAVEKIADASSAHGEVVMVVVEFGYVDMGRKRTATGRRQVNQRIMIEVHESMGQAAMAARLLWPGAEIQRMNPWEWRRRNGLKANSSKDEVHKKARELGWETSGNQDAADAGLMACAGLDLANSRVQSRELHRQVPLSDTVLSLLAARP